MTDEEKSERSRVYYRRWRDKDPERARRGARIRKLRWNAKNPEKLLEQQLRGLDKRVAKQREKRRLNGDAIRERERQYRAENRERISETSRRWWQRHRERLLDEAIDRYRMLREQAIDSLGGMCSACGHKDRRALDIDHREPVLPKMRNRSRENTLKQYRRIIAGQTAAFDLLCCNCHRLKAIRNGEMLYRRPGGIPRKSAVRASSPLPTTH